MDTIEVRVLVPIERETEFYRWFADWRDGVAERLELRTSDPVAGIADGAPLAAATDWWKSLTLKERAIWSIWLDAAPSMVQAEEIVASLGLKGARDIPGILSWSGRKGRKAGFAVDWSFRVDPVSGLPIYGIENAGYADLLRQARNLAGDTALTRGV
ncbi:MAG: hypothetical protein ABIO06_09690 [Pseudolysinimonas sp.]